MRQLIFDTETTGLNDREDRIVSLAALEMVDGELTGAFCHYHLNPGKSVGDSARIHGLTDEYLADKPPFASVVDAFKEFVGGSRLIIHNAPFDMGFLAAEYQRLHDPRKRWDPVTMLPGYKCTLAQARAMRGFYGKNKLDHLANDFGVDNLRVATGKHGALVDTLILFNVYRALNRAPVRDLLQSQLDHYLNKGFGVHNERFASASPGGQGLPATAQPLPADQSADVRALGG